ncbi:Pfk27 [Kluyveromyces lactis]|nr:Pfk27 [Kluyveromyces lactis]
MSRPNENLRPELLRSLESRRHLNSRTVSTNTSTNSLFSLHGSSSSSIYPTISHTETEIDVSNHTDGYFAGLQGSSSANHAANNSYLSQGSSLTIQFGNKRQNLNHKFCVILIGLPATGKSTISRHLINFLHSSHSTAHLRCSIFNAGNVRRKLSTRRQVSPFMAPELNKSEEDVFNPKNSHKKEEYARIALSKLLDDLEQDRCDLAIFDATNSTLQRRNYVLQEIRSFNKAQYDKHNARRSNNTNRARGEDIDDDEDENEDNDRVDAIHITPIFLQVSCTDPNFIKYNIHNKTFNQDYYDKPYEFAVKDFAKRLQQYHSQFVQFSRSEFDHYCKENARVNEGSHNPNFGLFFFHIMNAGQFSADDSNMYYFPSQYCSDTAELINTMEYFMENYSKMYGYGYIEKANEFLKCGTSSPTSPQPSSSRDRSDAIDENVRKSNIMTLHESINDTYLQTL